MTLMRNIIIASTSIMFILLFTDNFGSNHRLDQAIWNLGHLFLFAAIIWLLLCHTNLKFMNWLQMLVLTILFSIGFGVTIECVQYFIGRYMELQDVITDLLGGGLGYVISIFTLKKLNSYIKFKIKILLYALIFVFISIAFLPIGMIILDNKRIENNFPMLADFEFKGELDRWETVNIKSFTIEEDQMVKNNHLLHVVFGVSKYPYITLKYFPTNWSGYDHLSFSIYNKYYEDKEIEMKIYDNIHNNNLYSDRFNKILHLSPGWNYLIIDLKKVYNAPKERFMDMQHIAGISFFLNSPIKKYSYYIDNINLSN